jgi:N-acetylmuramoyl-L-alanine amidase
VITLRDPPRVVLDLDAVEMSSELQRLPSLVAPTDPYISRIRFGRQPQDVLRVVLDLREDVKTELFALAPVASFGHRVVLDLYPLAPVDPLMALLQESRSEPSALSPARAEAGPGESQAPATKPAAARRRRSPSRSTPVTAARTPARSAAAARRRSTSCWRSRRR